MQILSSIVRRLVVSSAVLGILARGAWAEPPNTAVPMQKYALLIGINEYAPPLGKLEYCRNDMTDLRAHLMAAGFREDNVTFMSESSQQPRLRPTKGNIEGTLRLQLQLANA